MEIRQTFPPAATPKKIPPNKSIRQQVNSFLIKGISREQNTPTPSATKEKKKHTAARGIYIRKARVTNTKPERQ